METATPPSTPEPQSSPRTPVLSSAELFRGQAVVWIVHDGQRYALRLTKQNKLLLTK